jgi:hypothetical protein
MKLVWSGVGTVLGVPTHQWLSLPCFFPRTRAPSRAARSGVAAVGSCRRPGPPSTTLPGPSPPSSVCRHQASPLPHSSATVQNATEPPPPPPLHHFFLSSLRQRSQRARELECFSILPLRGALRHHQTTPKSSSPPRLTKCRSPHWIRHRCHHCRPFSVRTVLRPMCLQIDPFLTPSIGPCHYRRTPDLPPITGELSLPWTLLRRSPHSTPPPPLLPGEFCSLWSWPTDSPCPPSSLMPCGTPPHHRWSCHRACPRRGDQLGSVSRRAPLPSRPERLVLPSWASRLKPWVESTAQHCSPFFGFLFLLNF